MAEKRRQKPRQTGVREPAPAYGTRPPVTEIFWLAFQSLTKEQKSGLLSRLLEDPEFYEELADAVAIIEARQEPSRPYGEFREEMIREGLLCSTG